ncbi:MAG: hypothetical protein GY752_04420 [bacterium]|nr:hypothetical protein [bacterium]MCP4801127.1 hypothetical protein [bacterium]
MTLRSLGQQASASSIGNINCQQNSIPCNKDCPSGLFELVKQSSVRGILHSHSNMSGGPHSLSRLAETASLIGLEYLGVTDRFMTSKQIISQSAEILQLNQNSDFKLLHGIEIEADKDGNLPLSDEIMSLCDFVVVTLKENHFQSKAAMTDRAIRAAMNPFTSILSHPIGDFMTMGENSWIDMELVLMAAAQAGVAIEVDANPSHANLDWHNCMLAQQFGVKLVISSDVHRAARLVDYRHGAEMIRSAGVCCRQILNSWGAEEVKAFFGSYSATNSSTSA